MLTLNVIAIGYASRLPAFGDHSQQPAATLVFGASLTIVSAYPSRIAHRPV